MRIAALLLAVFALVATQACEAHTFFCTDIGNTGWTCYCKVTQIDCGAMGNCMATCPLPD